MISCNFIEKRGLHKELIIFFLIFFFLLNINCVNAQDNKRTFDNFVGYVFDFGVDLDWINGGSRHPFTNKYYLADFAAMGGKFVRFPIRVDSTNFYNCSTKKVISNPLEWKIDYYDSTINDIKSYGLEPVVIVGTGRNCGIGMHDFLYPGYDGFTNSIWEIYVKALADKYKDKIKIWEIENEPEGYSAESGKPFYFSDYYPSIYKIAYNVIKSKCSSCKVSPGSLGHPELKQPSNFKSTVNYFVDFWGVSVFSDLGGTDPIKPENFDFGLIPWIYGIDGTVDYFTAGFASDKPIWFNETGAYATEWNYEETGGSKYQLSKEQQANYYVRHLLLLFSRKEVEKAILAWIINDIDVEELNDAYEKNGWGRPYTDNIFFHAGLIKSDGTHKRSYDAIKNTIEQLKNYGFVTKKIINDSYSLEFSNGAKSKFVIWNSKGKKNIVLSDFINIKIGDKINVINLYGEKKEILLEGYFEINESPQFVEIIESIIPPSTPSNLTAQAVFPSQINLTWQDNSNNENGFKIERKTGATGTYSQIATVSANVSSYSNTGLTANTTYYYRVRAYNTAGNSSYSNEVSTATPEGSISEMTIAELQAKIIQLLAQIAQLKTQLAQLQGIPDIPVDFKFTQTLRYGQRGLSVQYLQIFLKAQGSEIYPQGLVTSYFGRLTQTAVIKFQEKYARDILVPLGLNRGTGVVGLATRAKINEILGR